MNTETSSVESERAGANALVHLLREIGAKGSADLAAHEEAHPDDDTDARDYRAIVEMLRSSVEDNMLRAGPSHSQGFLRAMADLLCMASDGCVPVADRWEPLKNTARAFA